MAANAIRRRIEALEASAGMEYNGGIRVLSFDPDQAEARPDDFRAFQERVKASCPGLDGRLFLEPVRAGWRLHWPSADDAAAVESIVHQDDLGAFLEMLEEAPCET